MRILAIDTSNYPLGVALIDDDKVIGEYSTNLKKNHSIRIMPAIESVMKDSDTRPQDLDKIVVAEGPGSYTGVRIGVTVAKTMAWSLGIPLSGVSSLEVLAATGRYFDGGIVPIVDARRGQVFTGLYRYKNGSLVQDEADQLIMMNDWSERLKTIKGNLLFIGNDVSIHQETIGSILQDKAVVAAITEHNPRPSELAFLGKNKPSLDVHSFVPNYIRLAEAEAKWLEARTKTNE